MEFGFYISHLILQDSKTFPEYGRVHTWCPSTSAQAPAQNGAVFRHWVPKISVPNLVPKYKVSTLWNSGVGTWKKGVFTLVPSENGTRAPSVNAAYERDSTFQC